jgi:choline dehydrogenase-like flavoprotein
MNDPVDVLIIGAGASGAAVAWSLADTKMHILCLRAAGPQHSRHSYWDHYWPSQKISQQRPACRRRASKNPAG